jgi:hypothetical protein
MTDHPKPKPRIEGETDETRLSTWGETWTHVIVRTRWIVSCPCHMNADYAIAVVPSWEAALEIVRVHLERSHA